MKTVRRKVVVNKIRMAVVAALLVSSVGLNPATALAQRDRYQDQRDRAVERWDRGEDRRDRREDRRDRREERWDRREDRRDRRDDRWDAARYYRYDQRYRARRLGSNDRIYRGYDNRYYCDRSDGTTGLIVGGLAGGVLGNIIAPGEHRTLGTVIGAGAGALLGRAIDRNNVTCR